MAYKANPPEDYINQTPEERKSALLKWRKTIIDNLPKGFEEGIEYGMINYFVSHNIYPNAHHGKSSEPISFMSFASQKNSINLYHNGIYAVPKIHDWFIAEYPKHSAHKLDIGKSCIRFKKMEDIPFELIGELCSKMTANEWIAIYEKNIKKK